VLLSPLRGSQSVEPWRNEGRLEREEIERGSDFRLSQRKIEQRVHVQNRQRAPRPLLAFPFTPLLLISENSRLISSKSGFISFILLPVLLLIPLTGQTESYVEVILMTAMDLDGGQEG
jgi:hypothetical protein